MFKKYIKRRARKALEEVLKKLYFTYTFKTIAAGDITLLKLYS